MMVTETSSSYRASHNVNMNNIFMWKFAVVLLVLLVLQNKIILNITNNNALN